MTKIQRYVVCYYIVSTISIYHTHKRMYVLYILYIHIQQDQIVVVLRNPLLLIIQEC